ncbi:MAG: tRNA dihydrouridine(20/20a) synthase DusA [Hyphomicrobiales bacterium]|nr:tRNA dihydrouridine(20/20a) synthase DusA [Hyphomicrobiales bacterium]
MAALSKEKAAEMNSLDKRIAVAPMMDWTDRHCRFFHRQLTRHALLHTEMIVTEAVLHGDRDRLLGFSPAEHPLALQIGGSDPAKLARAARIGQDHGYDEINLNVGCPSDRVRSGAFGACLMREPALVGDCVAAMKAAVTIPVTVKCRLGVDEQDPGPALDALADAVVGAGCDGLWVHARKAWLSGLSPKENREVPPLDYERVYALKRRLHDVFIGINGGVETLEAAADHLRPMDGVMLGRAAYQRPAILADIDRRFYGASTGVRLETVVEAMITYAGIERARGTRLHQITRHMLGLFHGRAGARLWRRILSVRGGRPDAGVAVLRDALAAVEATGGTDHGCNGSAAAASGIVAV